MWSSTDPKESLCGPAPGIKSQGFPRGADWRAGIISNALFGAGVAAVVLRGTTWASNRFWAPDGAYSRYIAPMIALAWIAVFSGLLSMRGASTARAAERLAVPAR